MQSWLKKFSEIKLIIYLHVTCQTLGVKSYLWIPKPFNFLFSVTISIVNVPKVPFSLHFFLWKRCFKGDFRPPPWKWNNYTKLDWSMIFIILFKTFHTFQNRISFLSLFYQPHSHPYHLGTQKSFIQSTAAVHSMFI